MANEHLPKKDIWKSIFRLIIPTKKRFALVVIISLLSTGVNLIEPLIYREAINDIAGLFVQKAKDDTRKEYGDLTESDSSITSIIEDSIFQENDSTSADSLYVQDSISNANQPLTAGTDQRKIPHRKDHVAGRTPQQALQTLLWAVTILFFVGVIGHWLRLIGDNMNVRLSCGIEQNFIQNTFAHVLRLPLGFFGKRSSAALSKQINQSEEVSGVVNGFSQQILPEIISLTGILIIMYFQNVTLTLIALSIIPFYLYIAMRSAKKLESDLARYYEQWEEVSARIQDALGGIKTVKLSGAENREAFRLKQIADVAYKDYIDRSKRSNRYVFWESMLTRTASALVLGYGGYLTLENKLTPGDVVMFVAYLDRLYDPIDSLASLWVELQQNIASMARAFKLVDNSVEEKNGHALTIKNGNVEFKNVHFGYTAEREVIKGISFTLAPGKVTAIVGTSGAGKTTLVDLLIKLYEPSSGEICIDEENLSHCDAASVRQQIGMVSADGAVFRGTLADNIRYKRPEATDEETLRAALAAGMEGTLQRLPEGLQTPVGENGIGLSVGERQRIQIARILVSQPRILVLDEATANLDYATEAEIKRTIHEIRKENTVIIIAHRYSMVRDADYVIVLSAGEVLEQGIPEELIQRKGWFANFALAAEQGSEEKSENNESDEGEDDEDMSDEN